VSANGDNLVVIGQRLDRLEDLLQQLVAGSAEPRRWLSITGAAQYASLSEESIRRLIATGKLTPHYPRRGRILIDRLELDGHISGSTRRPVGAGRGRYERTQERQRRRRPPVAGQRPCVCDSQSQ
jgi:excisionase family DNA binding protein